jgi:hypothetical protein
LLLGAGFGVYDRSSGRSQIHPLNAMGQVDDLCPPDKLIYAFSVPSSMIVRVNAWEPWHICPFLCVPEMRPYGTVLLQPLVDDIYMLD